MGLHADGSSLGLSHRKYETLDEEHTAFEISG
jgi:hypothetical protein